MIPNFERVTFQLLKELVNEIEELVNGKLSLGTKELARAGNSLRPLSVGHKSSPSQCVGNRARQAGNWHS